MTGQNDLHLDCRAYRILAAVKESSHKTLGKDRGAADCRGERQEEQAPGHVLLVMCG